MKTRTTHRRPFWAVLAVVASLFLALLITAPGVQANIGAGATILNTVQIDYKDASGTTSYSANATTYVTVNRVASALTFSGRPTVGSPGKTAACPANQTVDSGATASYLIALTANANGGDTYSLASNIGTVTNMASNSVTWATMRNDGTTTITTGSPSSVVLGASVIQANTVNTISIPGGSTLASRIQTNAAGFKVLVVNGVDYIVSGITAGTTPSNTHVGATYYNDLGVATAEALAVISLSANPSGANVAPAFTAGALIGTVAAEQILVRLDYTGVVGSTPGVDGSVEFWMSSTNGGGASSCHVTTTFRASNMQVRKRVRNVTQSGSFAASASGVPGDILEYEVLVTNAGGSVGKEVRASDAVPIYTKLVCGGSYPGTSVCTGTGTDIIATINDGTNTSPITYRSTDDECSIAPTNVGAGDAAGFAEGSAIHFYMGNTCNGITPIGGNVTSSATYTILYRVIMN